MAIGHDKGGRIIVCLQPVHIGCAQGDHQQIQILHDSLRFRQAVVDMFETILQHRMRENTVVHPTVPLATGLKHFLVSLMITPAIHDLTQGLGYGQGIVESAERIEAARDFQALQSAAYHFCKTRTEHHDMTVGVKAKGGISHLNRREELHLFGKCDLQN